MKKIRYASWSLPVAILVFAIILVACRQEGATPTAAFGQPTQPPQEPAIISSTAASSESVSYPAQVATYDLGEATIVQEQFPEDSQFYNMPVQLDGVIGLPESAEQHPVVLILHGSHILCTGEHTWPCQEERKNYAGLAYLVEELAKAGYVALSINVNAEHTDAYGEGRPAERTKQLIDLHLGELAVANAGASNRFGLDLTGRADLSRLVWLGHSRGAEHANRVLREHGLTEIADEQGYGPVQGLLQIAPALVSPDSLPAANLPIVTILPACDRDFILLVGQGYYESARFDLERQYPATAAYLEGANHNYFNANLEPEFVRPIADRADCAADTMISAEVQQEFLVKYSIDFLQLLYADPDSSQIARQRLGMLSTEAAPDALYDMPAKVNFLPAPSFSVIWRLSVPSISQLGDEKKCH